jgi:hypothetical protein
MRLKLTLNIGTADRDRLQISGEGKEGDVVEVSEDVGKEIVRRGWAVQEAENHGTGATPAPAAASRGAEFPHTAGQPVPPAPPARAGKGDTSAKTAEEKGKASPIPADRRQAPGGTGL